MSVSNPNKTVAVQSIPCSGSFDVNLSFDASSELIERPSDIVLVLDRSGSMTGERMDKAKKAAKDLINLVAKASGGIENEILGNKSRIGLVSFAFDASVESPLTDNVKELITKIDALVPNGKTNHEDAFQKAKSIIDFTSTNDKLLIMFTDGESNIGDHPDNVVKELKANGVEIFCIGLVNNPVVLNRWASDPDSTHVSWDNDPMMLENIFNDIAYEAIKAGAYDVVIREELNPDFKIKSIGTPSNGTVELINPQTLEWKMNAVGAGKDEKVNLSFQVMHIGKNSGLQEVNKKITYFDRAGDILNFPNPTVNIECKGNIVNPEPCPIASNFTIEGCKDSASVTLNETSLQSLGRVVQLDVPIKNICPNKRVAVAVILSETDANGMEHSRGLKTFLVPSLSGAGCKDVLLKCVSFVLPEELDELGSKTSICNERKFKARVIANYVDTDFVCCDTKTVMLNN